MADGWVPLTSEISKRLSEVETGSVSSFERGATWTYITSDQPFGSLDRRLMTGLIRKIVPRRVYCFLLSAGHEEAADPNAGSVLRLLSTVFREPIQLLPYLDFSMPGIIAQAMALAREDQQRVRHVQSL